MTRSAPRPSSRRRLGLLALPVLLVTTAAAPRTAPAPEASAVEPPAAATPAVATSAVATPAGCPTPLRVQGADAWYAGAFAPATEIPSRTVCEEAGGSVLVMKRSKDGVQAYVCTVDREFRGPDVEAALDAGPAPKLAQRLVPSCPLKGKRESRVTGAAGSRVLHVSCVASISPKAWCRDPRAQPAPHGRGCFRTACPPGHSEVDFRGSAGACVACPAGSVDMRETVDRNPEAFGSASGWPFVPPGSVTWICKAPREAACRPPP